jgi:hypothetical protein
VAEFGDADIPEIREVNLFFVSHLIMCTKIIMLISLIIHIVQHIAHVDLNPALDPSNMTDAMVSHN